MNAIAVRDDAPHQVIATVNSVAGACKAIVAASAMKIQGRSYVRVEGWQAIAAAHGCTASADSVTAVPGGIAATATIRRLVDGAILGQAEGFVGDDERMWAGRPMYARRAMAQTRAISRACRSAFAHVVVAMNAGHGTDFSTTPAEEIPQDDDSEPQRHDRSATPPAATPPAATATATAALHPAIEKMKRLMLSLDAAEAGLGAKTKDRICGLFGKKFVKEISADQMDSLGHKCDKLLEMVGDLTSIEDQLVAWEGGAK